jgi:hypothetical protein
MKLTHRELLANRSLLTVRTASAMPAPAALPGDDRRLSEDDTRNTARAASSMVTVQPSGTSCVPRDRIDLAQLQAAERSGDAGGVEGVERQRALRDDEVGLRERKRCRRCSPNADAAADADAARRMPTLLPTPTAQLNGEA